ncbi:MAG: hypothetical protein ACE5JU_19105 [Candidatus Binatia bacterium]
MCLRVKSCSRSSEGSALAFGRRLITVILIFWSSVATGSPYLPEGPGCSIAGTSPNFQVGNYLFTFGGAGAAVADINKNGKKDLILVTYSLSISSPSGSLTYTIGWDIDPSSGTAAGWSPLKGIAGISNTAMYDVGVAIGDINRNGEPDMLIMTYALYGARKFFYRIAWDLDASGNPASTSNKYEATGVGNAEVWDGAGVALTDIDGNGELDMVLMAYVGLDKSRNAFRYRIGWDINANGTPTNWTPNFISVPGLGKRAAGADLAIEDIDLDGTRDMILMVYDTTDGKNAFRYKIGWRLNTDGKPHRWSRWFQLKGVGTDIVGAGLTYFYHQISGPRLIMVTHYRPEASRNKFKYLFLPVTTSGAYFGRADDYPPRINNQLSVPTSSSTFTAGRLFNLNMSEVRQAANEAVANFLFGCLIAEVAGGSPPLICRYNFPDVAPSFGPMIDDDRFDYEMAPDALVASVAWYVDYYMGWTTDKANEYVLNEYHDLNYFLGGSHVPAYYTIVYTDPGRHDGLVDDLQDQDEEWAMAYNDGKRLHGDCEDFAILRHALLRALGFDRHYIWNANAPSHQFNVVLYRGALRIMDYGPIFRYLDAPSGITAGIFGAWNTNSGPNQSAAVKQNNLCNQLLKTCYPDRCKSGTGWAFTRMANPDIE